jgi:hypothetical protein
VACGVCADKVYVIDELAMTDQVITAPQARTDDDWAAVTTSNQFKAIGIYANQCMLDVNMWKTYATKLQQRPVYNIDENYVRQMLVNSWNTERLLEMTRLNFKGAESGFVVQWAFPQAYYSAYNSTLASFASSGLTQKHHSSVCKKIADQACASSLPSRLNIYADGGYGDVEVNGITTKVATHKSAVFEPDDPDNINAHIISYFKSTRRMDLEDKRDDLKLKTRNGKIKQKLSKSDWHIVSQKEGKTSWLCLLYRKRIKSNYRDINTFLSSHFETEQVLIALSSVVWMFNFQNEINIVIHFGYKKVASWMQSDNPICINRLATIRDTVL